MQLISAGADGTVKHWKLPHSASAQLTGDVQPYEGCRLDLPFLAGAEILVSVDTRPDTDALLVSNMRCEQSVISAALSAVATGCTNASCRISKCVYHYTGSAVEMGGV